MIANLKSIIDRTLYALITLERLSEYQFYPCGSRFFGDTHHDSDYDFFIEDSEAVKHELCERGFRDQKFNYPDHNSVCVMKLEEVHVITVRSVSARLAAQEYIIKNDLVRPKRDSHWWCKLYEELRDKGLISQWWEADIDDQGMDESLEKDFEWKPN